MAFRERDESDGPLSTWLAVATAWLRWLFLEDWSLKLLALVISLGLWWGVTGQRTPATVRIAGVQLSYRLPPQMEISNDPRREAEITLTGAERLLEHINARDLVAYVDLSGFQPGDRLVSLTRDRVAMGLPEGVRIDDIEPNAVPLRLELRADRDVKVEPRLEESVPEGYEVRAVRVTPETVRVRGPQSHINMLQSAPTETILIGGRNATFVVPQVAIDIPDQKINVLDPVVSVEVVIGEKRVEKSFNDVVVTSPSGGNPHPSVASVTLAGPRSALDDLHSADVKLALDRAEDGTISPRLMLPPGKESQIELRTVRPSAFSITQ